jgi:hypothetical protein
MFSQEAYRNEINTYTGPLQGMPEALHILTYLFFPCPPKVRKDIKIVIFMLSLDAQKVRYDNGEI